MIEIRDYYPPADASLRGNALATFLPPLTPDALGNLISSAVLFALDELTHPPHMRMQYALRLMEYFFPQPHQLEFAWKLWMLILNGYKRRNPARQSASDEFRAMCRSILAGEPEADNQASFLDVAWCAILLGTPGCGKSATCRALLRRLFPDLFHHVNFGAVYQLGYIIVQAPKHGTGKSLAQAVFHALRAEAVKTGHPVPFIQREPKTEPELTHAVKVLAEKLNLGVLVLEELQHLYAGTGRMDAQAMKFLTGVVNTMRIPILFVATWECLPLLEQELRIGRRATTPIAGTFKRMQEASAEWSDFMDGIGNVQFLTNSSEVGEDERARFYFHTQGIHDACVKLMVMCQFEAIASKQERLSVSLIDAVAERHMQFIAPSCTSMREGTQEEVIGRWDVEPANFERYVQRFLAHLAASNPVTVPISGSTASGDAAAATSTKSPKGSPARDKLEKPRLTGSRTQKAMNAAEPKFLALDEADVRRVTFLAVRNNVPAEKALREAGYVCNLADELAA